MTPIVNLNILAKIYTQLSRSVFFDRAFKDFSGRTAKAIDYVIDNEAAIPEEIINQFQAHLWQALPFVRGSRSNDAPHETQYVLKKALREWISEDVLISSASLEDLRFYLNTLDLWEFINNSIGQIGKEPYSPLVVRIGSPEAYKHRPVFCVPLFHELGHFVDHHNKISEASLLLYPPPPPPPTPDKIELQTWQSIILRHRMEHFADLFAASYCGHAITKSIEVIAPNAPNSATHPATNNRITIVDDFLSSKNNVVVDIFQNTLVRRGQNKLTIKFTLPNISASFDDIIPYVIKSDDELYGIFHSSWDYLHEQLRSRKAPWLEPTTSAYIVEKTINDLVEKSIRNYEIQEGWKK